MTGRVPFFYFRFKYESIANRISALIVAPVFSESFPSLAHWSGRRLIFVRLLAPISRLWCFIFAIIHLDVYHWARKKENPRRLAPTEG
jgi:hypothetical protein